MIHQKYIDQVDLLLKILPYALSNKCFALKGGTAINLFYQNLPRLSVDIDLVYMPVEPRKQSFTGIYDALAKLKHQLEKDLNLDVRFTNDLSSGKETKLIVSAQKYEIKIEPNFTLRGALYPNETRELCINAQEQFGKKISVNCVSLADVYAGKLCAAFDRQHPRDMFDCKVFLENEDMNDEIKYAFIFYLLSNTRPVFETLNPQKISVEHLYTGEFLGMLNQTVPLENLYQAQREVLKQVHDSFLPVDRAFLISFASNSPDWSLYPYPKIKEYPSIQWKMLNQRKMSLAKRNQQVEALKQVLHS